MSIWNVIGSFMGVDSTLKNVSANVRHAWFTNDQNLLKRFMVFGRNAKVLSNTVKQKRKDKAGKWEVPIPKVKPVADDEMFKVLRTGKKKNKAWKRVVTKCTFVGENFTRKAPKYERFIRPMGLRMKKANVTHPELQATFQLDILGVRKNPSSALYTNLGVMTKGTIIEVNVSELGLVTTTGKVAWGKMAQITNNPELDGCVNAVLLV